MLTSYIELPTDPLLQHYITELFIESRSVRVVVIYFAVKIESKFWPFCDDLEPWI